MTQEDYELGVKNFRKMRNFWRTFAKIAGDFKIVVDEDHISFPGHIRQVRDGGSQICICPVCGVVNHVLGGFEWSLMARLANREVLGLPEQFVDHVVDAADLVVGDSPAPFVNVFRMRMLRMMERAKTKENSHGPVD